MAQTYAQLEKQIAALQAKAAKLKRQEVGGVIAKIKKAIAAYGITAQELFGQPAATGAKATAKKGAAKKSGASRVRYTDGTNKWSGFGPQPRWLKEALASGKSLDDLRVQ